MLDMVKEIDDARVQARMRKARAIAVRANRRYYRVETDDAQQQALLTMYEADRRYEQSTTPREAYVFQAAKSQMVTFVWQTTAPVHITYHALRDENRSKLDVTGLRGVEIDPQVERGERRPAVPRQLQAGAESGAGEDQLDRHRLRERVAEMLAEIEPCKPIAYAAVRVLIKESGPKEESEALAEAGYTTARAASRRITKAANRIREELMSRPDLLAMIRGI